MVVTGYDDVTAAQQITLRGHPLRHPVPLLRVDSMYFEHCMKSLRKTLNTWWTSAQLEAGAHHQGPAFDLVARLIRDGVVKVPAYK